MDSKGPPPPPYSATISMPGNGVKESDRGPSKGRGNKPKTIRETTKGPPNEPQADASNGTSSRQVRPGRKDRGRGGGRSVEGVVGPPPGV